MKTYRNLEIVSAYKTEEFERIVTRDGVRDVAAGMWVLYGEDGVRLMDDAPFLARFGEWDVVTGADPVEPSSGDTGLRDSGDALFYDPNGKPVSEVVAYMAEHPNEVEAIKDLESTARIPRKGIMEFTG